VGARPSLTGRRPLARAAEESLLVGVEPAAIEGAEAVGPLGFVQMVPEQHQAEVGFVA
jgi:hypothetical protein